MKHMQIILAAILSTIFMLSHPVVAAENGAFGTYLVGFVDLSPDNYTVFQIINPTSRSLHVHFGFFDQRGNPTGCQTSDLPPNGMLQIIASVVGDSTVKPPVAKANVVKIVSLDKPRGTPTNGIVGFQRHYYQAASFTLWGTRRISESNLAAVSTDILTQSGGAELTAIFQTCNQ
jgi:hypothetical protein